MEKTIEQLNCLMKFEWNSVLKAWNGYLAKANGTAGYIKAFIYDTKEESLNAATIWANKNKSSLKNPRPKEKILKFTSVEEGLEVLKNRYTTDSEVVSGEYADWIYEDRFYMFDTTIPLPMIVQSIQAFRSWDFEEDDSTKEEFEKYADPINGHCFIDGELVPIGMRIGVTKDGMTVLDKGIHPVSSFFL